jgi:dihydroflavonol-4-reductase
LNNYLVTINKQKTILIPIPDFLILFIGLVGDIFRFFGFKTDVSSENTKVLTIKNYYTNEKVKKALNMKFTPNK